MKLLAFFLLVLVFVIAELKVETLNKVECKRKTKDGDELSMHYRGTLLDGKEFDSSHKRSKPFEFKLGAGMVIKGWDQGLKDMCVGEKRKLTIPPELGYGSRGAGGSIPPDSTLIFEVELVGIKGVKREEL